TLNSLIVSGTQKDYDSILPLIQELDVPPSAEKELRMLVYPMRYADPSGIVGAINNAFRTMGRRSPADQVNATIDWGTQSVIVSASPANHEKVRALIESVDVESTLSRQLHTVKLENADAESVARTLQEVFRSSRRGTRRGEQPVSVTPDLGTNSLLITASAKEMEDLAPLIASLDVKPEFERDRIFKSFKLTFAESWGVKQMIDETFRVRGGRSANPRDMVTCMAEWGSNSLIVTASPEKMEQVDDLIAEVDQQGAGQREVHVVTIKHADPAAVNQALNEIFVRGARGRRGGETISISNPRGADTLLIKANETEFAEILAAVEALDVSEVELDQIQIVPLKHVDAADAVEVLQEYLRKPGGRGGRSAELAGDMRISAASSTNALVISGDLEEIEHLTGIIAKIDVEIEDDMRAPKIIKLQYASALEIEQSLTSLFNEGGRGGRGRGGRGRGGSMLEAPTIVADEGTNALIVRASAVDFKRIEELVASLDVEDAASGTPKVITLEYVRASDLEESLTVIFSEQRGSRGGRGRRGRSGGTGAGPVIVADDGTNSLIVRASAVDFARIGELVARLDTEDAAPEVPRIIKLEHAQASEIEASLTALFTEPRGGRRGRGARGGGAAPTPVIVADDSSNSLIVRAATVDFKRIEELVVALDTEDDARAPKIIRLEYANAVEIEQSLTTLFAEQGAGRGRGRGRGRSGSPTTGPLIVADEGTNSLLVRASSVDFTRIQELVVELDREDAVPGAPKIISLQYAQASEIEPHLTSLFAEQRGRGGRGGRSGAATMTPIIVADDGSNSLIVRASLADYKQIESVVAALDDEEIAGGPGMKIVGLKPGVNATEMAEMLDDMLEDLDRSRGSGGGRRGRGGGQSQRVLVRADVRSNSLILSGPRSKFDEVEQFIRELEGQGPAGGTVSTVIRIKGDPEELKRLIDEVVQESRGGSSGTRRGGSRRRR
ncbi:MAG: secretin N-terminal domain-containing protein, partial [Planctomycetota bacterium]